MTEGRKPEGAPRWALAMLAVSIVAPACFAAARVPNVADAAHDVGLVRAVGLGWTGGFRALDAVVASVLAWVPLGTRGFRAALAGAATCGAAGGVLFAVTRRLLAACAPAPRLGPAIAAIASTTATLSLAWQIEATAPAGGVLGALLALLPLAIVLGGETMQTARIGATGLALGLALSYEPAVGFAAALGVAIVWATSAGGWRAVAASRGALACGVLVGLVPFGLALLRGHAGAGLAMSVGAFAAPLGERGESAPGSPWLFVRDELGGVAIVLALAGTVVALLVPRARGAAGALVAIAVVGFVAMPMGAPAGETRFGAPVLATLAAVAALGAVAMQAGVRAVAAARVPFAAASAVMIVVLEATFPVRAADEALTRSDARARGAVTTWDELAWGPLPAGAVVMVSDRPLMTRLLASRASGALRGDLALVPTFDLRGALATRELLHEPKLQPFWRDMALVSAPDEWSLSSLAAARPLVLPFEPRWDRTLARHLVPVGLFARFEAEPRGTSDRRRALDELAPHRARLVRAITSPADPELLAITSTLLRARALSFAASGDRDLIAHALDDLRPFSPGDPIAAELVRRVVNAKGPIDVKDLTP